MMGLKISSCQPGSSKRTSDLLALPVDGTGSNSLSSLDPTLNLEAQGCSAYSLGDTS